MMSLKSMTFNIDEKSTDRHARVNMAAAAAIVDIEQQPLSCRSQ